MENLKKAFNLRNYVEWIGMNNETNCKFNVEKEEYTVKKMGTHYLITIDSAKYDVKSETELIELIKFHQNINK